MPKQQHWRRSTNVLDLYLRNALSFQRNWHKTGDEQIKKSIDLFVKLVLPAHLKRARKFLDIAERDPCRNLVEKATKALEEVRATVAYVVEMSTDPDHLGDAETARHHARLMQLRPANLVSRPLSH